MTRALHFHIWFFFSRVFGFRYLINSTFNFKCDTMNLTVQTSELPFTPFSWKMNDIKWNQRDQLKWKKDIRLKHRWFQLSRFKYLTTRPMHRQLEIHTPIYFDDKRVSKWSSKYCFSIAEITSSLLNQTSIKIHLINCYYFAFCCQTASAIYAISSIFQIADIVKSHDACSNGSIQRYIYVLATRS